jgi:hypothetical protein
MTQMLIVDDNRWFVRPQHIIDGGATTLYARTVAEAIQCLRDFEFFELSLDHDLGPEEDIKELVNWMLANNEWLKSTSLHYIYVHSMNPVGAEWIINALKKDWPGIMRINLDQIGKVNILEDEYND